MSTHAPIWAAVAVASLAASFEDGRAAPSPTRSGAPAPASAPGLVAPTPARVVPTAPSAPAPAARAPDPPDHAVEGRAGVLVPSQVLDGASLHVVLGWRSRLVGPLWLTVEAGANRTTVTALTEPTEAPGGAVTLRADHEQWTLPLIAGLAVASDSEGVGLGVSAGVGPALTLATLRTSAVGGERLGVREETRLDVVATGRVDAAWPVRPGRIIVGLGWQEVLTGGDDRPTGDVRASGLVLEAGWRALF